MLMVTSSDPDPYFNLAVEDYLLDQADRLAPALFLWRGRRSVVIGKHQNPWRESRLGALRAGGGVLARRISGGGAVYHDEGNLNYAFFVPRDGFAAERQYAIVLAALGRLGYAAGMLGRTSLAVEGRKVSGNAFCYRRQAVMHHGTLLVCADLAAMRAVLTGGDPAFATHAVASAPAEVANLADWQPALDPAAVGDALQQAFREAQGGRAAVTFDAAVFDARELAARRATLATWDWCYGHTPAFELGLEGRLPWGALELRLRVEGGLVAHAAGEASAAGDGLVAAVEAALRGAPFGAAELSAALARAAGERGDERLAAVGAWLATLPY